MQNKFIFAAIIFFSSANLFAENSIVATIYNQVKYGQNCGSVTRDDLKKAGFTCGFNQPLEKLQTSSWEIFDWNIFKLAANNQVDKNQCLVAQAKKLQGHDEFNTWKARLVMAWLGMKKAELIIRKCPDVIASRVPKKDILRYGYQEALKMSQSKKKIQTAWDKLCDDKEKMKEVRLAHRLFPRTMPVITDDSFFKAVEKNRNMIVNDKTGKPLSDDELLAADLQNLDFLRLESNDKFSSDVKETFQRLISERESMTQKFLDIKSEGKTSLDSGLSSGDLKTYIYQDGTLVQTLIENNQMGPNYTNLDHSYDASKEPPVQNEKEKILPTPISNGAFCMMAHYEPTIVGELINMTGQTALGAGTLYSLLKGGRLALTAGQSVDAVVKMSLIKMLYNSCIAKTNQTQKVVSRLPFKNYLSYVSEKAPKELGFESWDFDLGDIPECKSAFDKNLITNKFQKANCGSDLLTVILPLKISLPLVIGPSLLSK